MKSACELKDCGFYEERAAKYLEAVKKKDYSKQLVLLTEQRAEMLNEMHVAAKRLDCIDYLIYQCRERIKEVQKNE